MDSDSSSSSIDIGALPRRGVAPLVLWKVALSKAGQTQQRNASALFPFCSRAAMWGFGISGPVIPSTYDASSLGQIKHGLGVVHVSGLNFACQLTSKEASSRTIRKLRIGLVSEARNSATLSYFEAYRKKCSELLMRHLIVVLGLKLDINRCSLARAMGLFPPTAASASLK